MMRILFDDILSAREGMVAVAVAKPWLGQAISKPATWNWFGSAIEPSFDGATGSRAVAEPSRATATLFETAVQLVKKYFPDDDHVFVYDNATTHLKWDADALSASKMTKGPSENFFVEVNATNESGKSICSPDGKIMKEKHRMGNATFNGVEQPLYFPDDHPTHPGQFKGMAQILTERGYDISQKKAQCAQKFSDCPKGSIDCCC